MKRLRLRRVACELDRLVQIADSVGVPLVEDNAHGLFGRYKEPVSRHVGELAAQSFHETQEFQLRRGWRPCREPP